MDKPKIDWENERPVGVVTIECNTCGQYLRVPIIVRVEFDTEDDVRGVNIQAWPYLDDARAHTAGHITDGVTDWLSGLGQDQIDAITGDYDTSDEDEDDGDNDADEDET